MSSNQDYTLIALVAIAAHLGGQPLGEGKGGLTVLAQRYQQDAGALEQVRALSCFVLFVL